MLTNGVAMSVAAEAVLSARLGSVCAPLTLAVVFNVPTTALLPTIVSVAKPLTGTLPTVQTTVPPPMVNVPCDLLLLTTVRLGKANDWLTTTNVAGLGPRFVTVTV